MIDLLDLGHSDDRAKQLVHIVEIGLMVKLERPFGAAVFVSDQITDAVVIPADDTLNFVMFLKKVTGVEQSKGFVRFMFFSRSRRNGDGFLRRRNWLWLCHRHCFLTALRTEPGLFTDLVTAVTTKRHSLS